MIIKSLGSTTNATISFTIWHELLINVNKVYTWCKIICVFIITLTNLETEILIVILRNTFFFRNFELKKKTPKLLNIKSNPFYILQTNLITVINLQSKWFIIIRSSIIMLPRLHIQLKIVVDIKLQCNSYHTSIVCCILG